MGPRTADVVRRPLLGRLARVPPAYWLALGIAVYFAVSLSLSWLRALELNTSTWDQGIYQQALWSTAHGRPFWEAPDAETGGYGSLLQVHSVFLLYLLVPLYAAVPGEFTLFVVQSAVVALAAIPLYWLGRDLTGSGRWGLVSGVVYLAWAPVLAANLYDFHAEAFLPIELFSFVLLWSRARYGWGFAAAGIAFATIELAPILLFFAGVFFLLPDRERWRAGVGRLRMAVTLGRRRRALVEEIRRVLGQTRAVAALALLAACTASYFFLLLLREKYLSAWFGFPPFPSTASGYVVGATPGELGLAWGNVLGGFEVKLLFWLALLALLGFVPLLAPRAMVLALPWMVFSFFSGDLNYVTFGFQYGFIVASSLLVAFTYGLVPIDRWLQQLGSPAPDASPARRGGWMRGRPSRRPLRRSRVVILTAVAFVALVAINVAASPVDPLLDNIGLGSGYRVSLAPTTGFADAQDVAALLPSGASVLASDNLFPLVANDVNAYSFFWAQDPGLLLPFTAVNLPSFVFISQSSTAAIPSWVSVTLYNASDYGVRGVAWSTPVGSVMLFERGFGGPAEEFGATPAPDSTYFGTELSPGDDGYVTTLPGTTFPSVVVSSSESPGGVWSGPGSSLSAGTYTVSVHLRAWPTNPSQPPGPSEPVLTLVATAFAEPGFFVHTLLFSTLGGSGWATVEDSFSVSEPIIEFGVEGLSLTSAATVAVEYVSIAEAT